MDYIEERICRIIDDHAERIMEFGRDIWHHAELGYREFRTSQKFKKELEDLGLEVKDQLAVTGVKGYLHPHKEHEITVALMGEMDALPIPNHVDANPETGAAHCCGHNAQLTGVFGAALALADPEVSSALGGNIAFMGVPAEENVDRAYKNELRKAGKIRYAGGKCELIRTGAFDDIDMAIAHHATSGNRILIKTFVNTGFLNKTASFHGKAAHAAMGVEQGVNAAAAARLAEAAIDAQRESFTDKEMVRVHGYTSKGAAASNVIADEVVLEYQIRAQSAQTIQRVAAKVDRAMIAGAVATGCGLTLDTEAGYLPRHVCQDYSVLQETAELFGDQYPLFIHGQEKAGAASSDDGDVSHLMPLFAFSTGGLSGPVHSSDLAVVDEYLCYVMPAKIFALTAYRLLKDQGKRAKQLVKDNKPLMTKEEYLSYMESLQWIREYPMDMEVPCRQDSQK